MLNEGKVFATLAVKDIAAGKKFYGETLGLKQVDENPGGGAQFHLFLPQADDQE